MVIFNSYVSLPEGIDFAQWSKTCGDNFWWKTCWLWVPRLVEICWSWRQKSTVKPYARERERVLVLAWQDPLERRILGVWGPVLLFWGNVFPSNYSIGKFTQLWNPIAQQQVSRFRSGFWSVQSPPTTSPGSPRRTMALWRRRTRDSPEKETPWNESLSFFKLEFGQKNDASSAFTHCFSLQAG